ncbi:hypothetical protein EAI35_07095 [Enterobacter bugandensis]|nr:hypothetical protein EAI35_07095 [Enterobacter bugandensis]
MIVSYHSLPTRRYESRLLELIFLQGSANELTTAQQIYLGMITGIHANLKDIMPDITKLVHCCIYDASAEADWHIYLFNPKFTK